MNTEHIVSGVVGGVVSLLGGYLLCKAMGCHDKKEGLAFSKKMLSSDKLAPSIGPFCAAREISFGGARLVFCSGIIGLCPEKKTLISDNLEEQVHQTLKNLKNLFHDNDLSFGDITKVNLYITDMKNFAAVN